MIHEKILKGLKCETYPILPVGGQSVGILRPGVMLTHEEFGFSITVDFHRGMLKNKEIAYLLFELFISTLDLEEYLKG